MSLNLVNSILRAGPALPLSVAERLCLIVLAYRADENGWTGLSKAGLARQTGQSKPTILNAVRRLGYMGLLESPKPLTLDVSALTKAIQRALDFDDDADDRPAWLGRKGKKVAQKGKENLYRNGQDFDHSDPQNDSAEGKKPLPFSVKNEDLKGKSSLPHIDRLETARAHDAGEGARARGEETDETPAEDPAAEASETPATIPETLPALAAEAAPAPVPAAPAPRVTVAAAAAVPDPTAGETRGWDACRPRDLEGLRAFLAAYPKKAANHLALLRAWAALERDGLGGEPVTLADLLGAVEEAKLTRGWQEEFGRFVPRPEKWLEERGFVRFLAAARERRAAPAQAEREAAEDCRAAEDAADLDW